MLKKKKFPYHKLNGIKLNFCSFQIPVYQRGGTIISKKERIRRAATLMHNDPYTLIVCLDRGQYADGTLYIDDEKSFEYRNGAYAYLALKYENNILSSRHIDHNNKSVYPTKSWLERVRIAGLKNVPKSATLTINRDGTAKKAIQLDVIAEDNSIVIRKPGINILEKWSITLNY